MGRLSRRRLATPSHVVCPPDELGYCLPLGAPRNDRHLPMGDSNGARRTSACVVITVGLSFGAWSTDKRSADVAVTSREWADRSDRDVGARDTSASEPLSLSALSAPIRREPELATELKCFETSLPSRCFGAAAWNFRSKASIATSFEIHSPTRADKVARTKRSTSWRRAERLFRCGERNNYELFDSPGGGGLTIYRSIPLESFCYYYAHLDGTRLIREGQAVHRGQVIGYVGSTGNASPDAPHLHFTIFQLTPERKWWKGEPQSLTPFSNSPVSNCVPRRTGNYTTNGLSPPAHAPRLQDAEVGRILPDPLRHAALEGGPIFWVATHRIHHQKSDQEGDPHTPREGTWWAHMGWILWARACITTPRCCALRPDLSRDRSTSGSPLALGRPTSSSASACSRSAASLRALGHLLPHDRRPPRHLAGELGDAHVGLAPLQDPRRLDQQLVGRAPDLRRRLAQQPPRPPDQRPSRPGLVRARSELDRHQHAARCSASPGTSSSPRSSSRLREDASRAASRRVRPHSVIQNQTKNGRSRAEGRPTFCL